LLRCGGSGLRFGSFLGGRAGGGLSGRFGALLHLLAHLLHHLPRPHGGVRHRAVFRVDRALEEVGMRRGSRRRFGGGFRRHRLGGVLGHLAHGFNRADRGALHFEALNGHLQHRQIHAQPAFDGFHVLDALVELFDIECRCDHAGRRPCCPTCCAQRSGSFMFRGCQHVSPCE
jgi:hypothetical protein